MPIVALMIGIVAILLLLVEMDRQATWRCPRCQVRSLRVVGTGGLWYFREDDFQEERVYWGECSTCGRRATRKGLWLT